MKSSLLKICALIALSSVAAQAEEPKNLVENGDFETGTGKAFYETPPWYNWGKGLNQGTSARLDESAVIDGSFSASVNDRCSVAEGKYTANVCFNQKTKYIIRQGDSFSFSYYWFPADTYWQTSRDTIRFVLFATADDKMSGPVVWSSEHLSDFFKGSIRSAMAVRQTSSVVTPEAVGKVLFVQFHGLDTVDGETGNWHYARVDNVVVSVLDPK